MRIEGQAAIVTGGASGLGLATARAAGGAGARVALLDLDAARVADAAGRLGGKGFACDVADAASAEQAVAGARAAQGPRPDPGQLRRHRAAGADRRPHGPLPLADFARVIQINLIGSFNLLRLAAADMTALEPDADGERGVIVNTASVAAFDGQIGQAAYAASKGGIVALTLPAARELARHGIRVMTIAPGIFETPMMRGLPETVQQALAASVPFPSASAGPRNTRRWSATSSTTRCSTARSSASTARSAWRRSRARGQSALP